jgi:addiction module HigA family antidote
LKCTLTERSHKNGRNCRNHPLYPEAVAGSSPFGLTISGAFATPHRVTAHLSDILNQEFLEPLAMSINALAIALRVAATRIGAIVKGELSVTADTALRLVRFFGTSPRPCIISPKRERKVVQQPRRLTHNA